MKPEIFCDAEQGKLLKKNASALRKHSFFWYCCVRLKMPVKNKLVERKYINAALKSH